MPTEPAPYCGSDERQCLSSHGDDCPVARARRARAKSRTAWERIVEEPPTKAEAVEAVLKAARRCKSFKTTATTPELKTLIEAIEAYDSLESE